MKKYLNFDDFFTHGRFERRFYCYCLFRQPGLIKYLPLYLVFNFLYLFRIKKREGYLAVRWSFLADTKDLDRRLERFFARRKKKMYIPNGDITVLSDHPRQLLEGLFPDVVANIYDEEQRRFPCYKSVCEFVGEGEYEAYGRIFSGLMRNAKRKSFVYGKRVYGSAASYIFRTVLHYLMSYGMMTVFSVGMGLVSLYFACRNHLNHADIFFSYLERPTVVLLNVLPIVFLCWFFYFLTNSTAIAVFMSSGLCMLLTWVNYYKLFFRNDPFLFGDIAIAMEAKMMTESYKVVLTPLIKVIMLGIVIFAVVMAIYFRAPIKNLLVRGVCFILSALIGYYGFVNVYLDPDRYTEALDITHIKQWSATDQFLIRGFLYPFLYSYTTAFDSEPEGYSEEYARELLSGYKYTDIPEDKKVNIISVMLESWGDLSKFESVDFIEGKDPYAMLDPLFEKSYHGELVNDIFSAGTIASERQFLTGMSHTTSFRKPTNSYAWYFSEQGYTVEGGHPCHDWFYNRVNINQNLGFQNYYFDQNRYLDLTGKYNCTDLEMFPDIMTLFDEAMERGEDYFSFNVTYEGHGPYAYENYYPYAYIERNDLDIETYNNINNYLYKMETTNEAILWLSEEVCKREEPVVLILFGDHMPGLGENNSGYASLGINIDLSSEEGFLNYYSTPYLILANDAAKKTLGNDFVGEGPLLAPYSLMTEFFNLAGYVGDEYMQYTADLYKEIQVRHLTGVLAKDGELIMDDIADYSDITSDFDIVQYYRRNNFVYD